MAKGRFTLWTMKSDHGRGPFSTVRVLYKLVLRDLGPSLGVKRMWTKKNDHPQKVMCWFIFIHAQKGQFWKKFKFDYSLVFTCQRCGLQIFSQHLLQKMSDLICTWSWVIYMWLVIYARGGHSMSSWTPCALKVCYPYITFHRWFYISRYT